MLMGEVQRLKREKKDAVGVVRQRDIEIGKLHKRVADMQKQIADY